MNQIEVNVTDEPILKQQSGSIHYNATKAAIISSVLFVLYTVNYLVIYFVSIHQISQPKLLNDQITWNANAIEAGCGTVNLTKMTAKTLYSCSYPTFMYVAYVTTLYRRAILKRTSNPIQDSNLLHYKRFNCRFVSKVCIRILASAIIVIPLMLPIYLVSSKDFRQKYLLKWFVCYMLPLSLAPFYLVTLYDRVVFWAYDTLGFNDEWD